MYLNLNSIYYLLIKCIYKLKINDNFTMSINMDIL